MPIIKSAKKALRQNIRRRERNLKRKAERLILELKDKFKKEKAGGLSLETDLELKAAIKNLGYRQKEIEEAIKNLGEKPEKLEERIKLALKILGKRA